MKLGYVAFSVAAFAGAASASTFTTFQVTGSPSTIPQSINQAGTVAGYYFDASYVTHGFARLTDGTIVSFDPPASVETAPTAINRRGVIAGYFSDGTQSHGFVRTRKGKITVFDPPGSVRTVGVSIDRVGSI